MDLSKVDNIEFDDVHYWDYPDYSDAYIISADYEGVPMTEEQLEEVNEYKDFISEKLLER